MLGAKLQVQFTQQLQRPESSDSPVSGLHFGVGSAEGHQFSGSPAAPVGREIDHCAENIFVCISISLFTDTVRFCFKIKRPFGIIARVRGHIPEALQHFMPYAFAPLCSLSDPIYAQSEAEECTPGVSCMDPDGKWGLLNL